MHLIIWTSAVMLLAACVHANDHTCKTNEYTCAMDADCTKGKCNTVQGRCCIFRDAPPTQCYPENCTNDDQCSQYGKQFRCNTVNGNCCGNDTKEDMVLSNPCPGESFTWTGECPNTACTATSDCSNKEACCPVGSPCSMACLPDLRPCTNATIILLTAIIDVKCLPKLLEIVKPENSLKQYCGALLGGLECIADSLVGPLLGKVCYGRMLQYIETSPNVLYYEIKEIITNMGLEVDMNDKFGEQSGKCKAIVDGNEEEDVDWNTACPKVEEDKREGCATNCSTATDCTTPKFPVCCSFGKDQCHTCMPDFRQCGNVTLMLSDLTKLIPCMPTFTPLIEATNTADYCSAVWETFDCLAEQLVTSEYKRTCLMRMAVYVREAPNDIMDSVADLVAGFGINMTGLKIYAKATAMCRESPLHKAPSRPVSDDVVQCADSSIILRHVGGCATAGESAADQVCSVFKNMVDCITDSILPDEQQYMKRKCAEEVYELIDKHRDSIQALKHLDSKTCREKPSVCGGDIKPLDDHNCTAEHCPSKFECKSGFCCPESLNKSKCELEFEHGKRELERVGTCGDGKSIINLPSCQNTRCHPIQVNIQSGQLYCVTEDCDKIPGSDFTGNRDCTTVRAGTCPSPPSECNNTGPVRNDCDNDHNCAEGQKCCLADSCVQKCVGADTAPANVVDDCPDRYCCPISLCLYKICLKDKTATCRINSCGGCRTKFYTVNNETVNCDEGVSVCEKQRAKAILENAKKRESDADRVFSFVSARDQRNREDNENNGKPLEYEEKKKDEYGETRLEKEGLMEDPVRGDERDDMKDKEAVGRRLCALFQQYDVCKHGSECVIGAGETFMEICKCTSGYTGLFCEQSRSPIPVDSKCTRDVERTTTITTMFNEPNKLKEEMILHEFFKTFRLPLMANYSCSSDGYYNKIQIGKMFPITSGKTLNFCADTSTGSRILGTPVTLSMSGQMPNCDITDAYPDAMRIPRTCLEPNNEACTGNSDSCQYFWNQETASCENGKAGYGFPTLTLCYEQCAMYRDCINHPTDGSGSDDDFKCEMGVISGPKPCKSIKDNVEGDICDYKSQFCEVVERFDGTQIGTCTDFPAHCLEIPNKGVGDKAIGGYYFNAEYRRCEKFDYKGYGGNKNRFYNLHQCHTECSAQQYRFTDSVCPIPRALSVPGMPKETLDMCHRDFDCYEGQVCCSNGRAKVCAHPVKTCYSGERCSQDGVCDAGTCLCDDCINALTSPVCGSDGNTYESICHVKREACKTMRNIHVAFNSSCTTECGNSVCESYEICDNNQCTCPAVCITLYEPICGFSSKTGVYRTFGNTCTMDMYSCDHKETFVKVSDGECDQGLCVIPCTEEYMPFCVNDITDSTLKQETYPNFCAIKVARICDNKTLEVLYQGECHVQCGVNQCELYEVCESGTCTCPTKCPREYNTICAHPHGNSAKLTTFPNECMLRQYACHNTTYVIQSHGNCKDPEPVYSCPGTKPGIPYSADIACNKDTNAYCHQEKGEMCCPHGTGRKCMKKTALVRHKEMKGGVCQQFTYFNYDKKKCVDGIRCMDDGDCGGDAQCCQNPVCGYNTCSEPLVRANGCGNGKRMVPRLTCTLGMASTGCPVGSTCTSAIDTPEEVGICCTADSQPDVNVEDIVNSQLCKLLELLSIECQNGGKCVGNFKTGPICDCTTGYAGPFCESATAPPTTPCLEQQAVLRQLYEKTIKPRIPATEVPCTVGQVQCIDGPCQHASCTNYPAATCTANYCGGCNTVFMMGYVDVSHQCQGNGRADQNIDVFQKKLIVLLEHLKLRGLPVDGDLKCADNGNFAPEQCITDMKSHEDVCYCVNPHTGVPVKNGPSRSTTDTLNCDIFKENNTARQEFCITEKPNLNDWCSGDSIADRYFYDATTEDCELFTDMGCNTDISNNFDSYESCKSTCGVNTTILSICARVRCGSGQHCRVKDGDAVCIDPEDGIFEPTCDADGKFHPKQCQGTVCQCVNPDTGEEIADSVADGKNLECKKEGGHIQPMKKEEKGCEDNSVAKFCKEGGDACKDCKKKDMPNNADHDEKVDENGVCKSCETCPASQRDKVCNTDKLCKTTCKQFADATCHINKCTCEEEYIGAGKTVNCNAAQSQCLKEKHNAEAEQRSLRSISRNQQDMVEIKCSSTGGYVAKCKGNVCSCLNAASGAKVDNAQPGVTIDTIDCESTQRKTNAEIVTLSIKVSNKELSEISQSKQDKMKSALKTKIEGTTGVSVMGALELKSGSVICVGDLTTCVTSDCVEVETSDLISLSMVLINEMTNWEFEVEGESFQCTDIEVVNITTTEMLYGPVTTALPPPVEEEEKETIIIVVVIVVVIVMLLAIGMACYCYSKANKTKTLNMPFTDIQARTNAAYGKA